MIEEPREFIGSAFDLRRLEARYDVLSVDVLVHTFPWWKRIIAWCLWRTPLRRMWPRRFLSPYGAVRAMLRVRPESSSEAEASLVAQAAEVLARDRLSREQTASGAPSRDGASH